MADTQTIPAVWRISDQGDVPAVDVIKSSGIDPHIIHNAFRHGIITPSRPSRRGSPRYITVSDAMIILAAMSLALAAGVAITSMIRALKSGAVVAPPTEGGVVQLSITVPMSVAA